MKKLNLELDLSFDKSPEASKLTSKQLWENFVVAGARTAYKDGVDLKMQSKLFKIITGLEKANGSLDLEDAEFEVIKEIGERAKFDPSFCRVGVQILQKIEEAQK